MVGCVVTGWIGVEWTGETWGRTGGCAAGWTGDAAAAGEVPDGQMGTIAGAAPPEEAAPAIPPLCDCCLPQSILDIEETIAYAEAGLVPGFAFNSLATFTCSLHLNLAERSCKV